MIVIIFRSRFLLLLHLHHFSSQLICCCSFLPTLHFLSKLIKFLFCRYNTVHGGWSSWSGWTSCSQSCGTDSRQRSRSCTSPPPRYGGNYCIGHPLEKQLCNKQSCPGKKRSSIVSLFLIHYPFLSISLRFISSSLSGFSLSPN